MKKIFISAAFSLIFLMITAFTYSTSKTKKVDPKTESEILELVYSILKTRHINPKKIDDDFSKKMFVTYLDSIDKYKLFLLQSDIDEFKKYETKLDDQIKENDLTFFFMTYDRIILRMREGKELYSNILKNKLDFTLNEDSKYFYSLKLSNLRFATNKTQQIKNWNQFLKIDALNNSKTAYISPQNTLNFSQILTDFSTNLATSYESTNINYANLNRDDFFQHYINSIIVQFDPHSKYYTPANRDKYLNNQTGKIIGAGITVNSANGFIQIKRLTEGGPAWKSNKFSVGDVILKIGQENEFPTNVNGFSNYDVAKLLKGKAGTTVKVTIKKANGKIEEIALKRGVVAMNDSYIKSCFIKKNKATYGFISFPRFYNDFDDENARNAADDFATELQVIKQANVKGLILDLRENEGGSVEAAVKIIGNFINKNPVIQLKAKDNNVIALESPNLKSNWDKNIVVIVNAKTASAAEIIASSFQEFKIGLVVGEQTFGKGTIQDFQDLNVFKPAKIGNKDLGAIKISFQKFYKPSGKSIQKNGVMLDVVFINDKNKLRESIIENALPTDEVKAIKISISNEKYFFDKIIKNSQERCLKSETFKKALTKDIKKFEAEENLKNIKTLNALNFEKQINDITTKYISFMTPEFDTSREFIQTPEGTKEMQAKPYLKLKREAWLEDLKTDYQVDESINILEDIRFLK